MLRPDGAVGALSSPRDHCPSACQAARLDALRGVPMVWMAAYYFAYDLIFFRLVRLRL